MSQSEAITSIDEIWARPTQGHIGLSELGLSLWEDVIGGTRMCEFSIHNTDTFLLFRAVKWEHLNEAQARETTCDECVLNARIVFQHSFGYRREIPEA